jgi:hypothetical protein
VSLSWEVIELFEGRDGMGGIGRLFAAQGNVDFRTPTGRLLFTQLQSLAQYQRENARQEWAVARTRAWERGVWVARAPLGYVKLPAAVKHGAVADGGVFGADGARFDADEVAAAVVGGLVRDPSVAPVVSELFERRRDGEPNADLARWLADRTGRPWAPTVVSKLLRNSAYLGEATLHRTVRDRRGAVIAREVMLSRPDDHEPLTTDATFRAVEHVRPVRRVTRAKNRDEWLLTGFVRCAGCRYMLRPSENATGFRSYICRCEHGMGRCPAPAYAGADELDTLVLRAVLSLDDTEITVRGADAELDQARAVAESLREEVRRLVSQLRRSRHPDLVEAELDDAEAQLEAADQRVAQLEQLERSGRGGSTRSLAEILSRGSADEKRAVVGAYLDRVVIRRGGEPLRDRSLLSSEREERAFEPLPGPGRRLALAPWPASPARGGDALQLAG